MTEPETCREAVWQAMTRLERRHGRQIFDLDEIAAEVMTTWTRWERSTVRTHVSSHMCRDAPVHQWPDLERVDRGRYRRIPHAELEAAGVVDSLSVSTAARGTETGHEFEARARRVLSELWQVDLQPRAVRLGGAVDKRFDLVSTDGAIVGDAKRYKSLKTPAAKWSTIAEYVWLLQHVPAGARTFLVFGGDIDVPMRWLHRFRPLARPVTFYYLDEEDELHQIADETGG